MAGEKIISGLSMSLKKKGSEVVSAEAIFTPDELAEVNRISQYRASIEEERKNSQKKNSESPAEYDRESKDALALLIEKMRGVEPVQRFISLISLRDSDFLMPDGTIRPGGLNNSQEWIRRVLVQAYHECEDIFKAAHIDSRLVEPFLLRIFQEERSKEASQFSHFDPQAELRKIKEWGKNDETLSHSERRVSQKEKLTEYKQSLALQLKGIGEFNAELEQMITESGTVDREKLEAALTARADTHKLTPEQIDSYRIFFLMAEDRNKTIQKFFEKYEGNDKEFFHALFGKMPKGKVSFIQGSVSVGVLCEDLEDYLLISIAKSDVNQEEITKVASNFGRAGVPVKIPALRGVVFTINVASINVAAMNTHKNNSQRLGIIEDTRVHEEKHIIDRLAYSAQRIGFGSRKSEKTAEVPDDTEKSTRELKDFLRGQRKSHEECAKREILAHLKEGVLIESIKSILLRRKVEGGDYDYFEETKSENELDVDYFLKKIMVPPEVIEKTENQQRLKYESQVLTALETMGKLEMIGCSRQYIIGLFQAEPLASWQKVYERVMLSEEFQKKLEIEKLNAEKEVIGWEEIEKKQSGILRRIDDWLRAPKRFAKNLFSKQKRLSRKELLQRSKFNQAWWKERAKKLSEEQLRLEKKHKIS